MQLVKSMWIMWQVELKEAQHSLFVKSEMQVMMQNHVLVKTPVQQFEPWLYQQVLLMQKSYRH